ncbi:MAG TPA: PilN domain-containing protein [Terriglobales bacterium]|jgi:type IV pilus assembly protein PilN|nr:PilN domain-containing protein [Terriglobales bacterium]
MRVEINLGTRPYEDGRQFWVRWGGGLAALSLVTLLLLTYTVLGWFNASKDRQIMSQYEAQIAKLDQEKTSAQAMLDMPQNSSTRDRSAFLNDLFERKAFSWTKVFEELERVMPARLHVVSIHPEMTPDNRLEIKLIVAGDSRDHALELVRRMEGSQRFQRTEIDEERSQLTQGQDSVEFSITALYVPANNDTLGRGGSQ